jgi:AcrR family transcriptional regulator
MTMVHERRKEAKPPSTGRRERRRAETREKLFRAAMKLFAERGFFATTTEDITEAADLGQGTFFNYFPTKQHVLTVLTEKQMEKVMHAREEVAAGKAPIYSVLNELMHRIAQEPGKSQALTRSLMAAFLSNDEVRQFVRDTLARGRESLGEMIRLGQKRGEIRHDRKPADLAMTFQRGVIGTLLLWALQSDDDLDVRIEKTFQDFWSAAEIRKE